jgi:single-strand DNA-binding protein
MYINKAILIGNITKDIELKSLQNGTKVASFSIATNRTYKDAHGNKQESVEYHNIVSFGKQAEVIAQYCSKGDSIYVEGRITTRSWDKDGVKMYRTEITLENFQFGNKRENKQTEQVEEKQGDAIDPESGIDTENIPF